MRNRAPVLAVAAHGVLRELFPREPAHAVAGQPHRTLTALRR